MSMRWARLLHKEGQCFSDQEGLRFKLIFPKLRIYLSNWLYYGVHPVISTDKTSSDTKWEFDIIQIFFLYFFSRSLYWPNKSLKKDRTSIVSVANFQINLNHETFLQCCSVIKIKQVNKLIYSFFFSKSEKRK